MVMGKQQKTSKDMSEEEMKKDFDEKMAEEPEEIGGDTKDSSSKEDTATDTSAGDDKTESGEEEKPVPYSRFKEINEEAKAIKEERERLRQENEELRRGRQETKTEEDPDELTEEEKLYFDEGQIRVINKLTNRAKRQYLQEEFQDQNHQQVSLAVVLHSA